MPLALYRRHRLECKGGHPHNSRTSEYDERKKGWKRCECPIFVSGTISGTFRQQNGGRWEWAAARVAAEEFEAPGSWNLTIPAEPHPEPPSEKQQRIAIADAVKLFLTNREGTKVASATLRKYRTFTKQLNAFADSRGYVMLDQFTKADIDVFYSQMELGLRAKAKRLGTLRSFFRFAMNREWLEKNPISNDLRPPIGANRMANKAPFTDDELRRILDACDRMPEVKWANWQGEGVWTGEDVKDFIWTMIYTGLRIQRCRPVPDEPPSRERGFSSCQEEWRRGLHRHSGMAKNQAGGESKASGYASVHCRPIGSAGNRHRHVAPEDQFGFRIGRQF